MISSGREHIWNAYSLFINALWKGINVHEICLSTLYRGENRYSVFISGILYGVENTNF
jgi:hypothetical protein